MNRQPRNRQLKSPLPKLLRRRQPRPALNLPPKSQLLKSQLRNQTLKPTIPITNPNSSQQ